ncbi:MAG: hypothetical protein K2Y37_03140 [Pirellulales bacterium]|nr:hypothetical protein [Pirellulales bacterium]
MQFESHDEYPQVRLQDLSTQEIAARLLSLGSDLRPADVLAVEQFVEQIGGLDNACAAIEMLRELELDEAA